MSGQNKTDSEANLGKRTETSQPSEVVSIPGVKVMSGTSQWWNTPLDLSKEDTDEKNWTYLEHHGVQFPAEHVAKGVTITFDGKPINLTPLQEEMAYYWCQTLGSEWEFKDKYRLNFAEQFSILLGDQKYKDIQKFNFENVIKLIEERKQQRATDNENRKLLSNEAKRKLKQEKLDKDAKYGFALLDYHREKIGGYTIEPPTLFKGRGDHPKSGLFKPRVYPEDVTINVSEDAPVPMCDLPGRAWKEVVHNPQVTWLAMYRDEAINHSSKYFFLGANSRLKGVNDLKKYEKARKLKTEITRIREDYMKKINSKQIYDKQLGTAAYFIDKLALRVGNEKNDEEEADTVGCCSLRKEHVSLLPDNQVKFDFLGKDSMRYENTITVEPAVWENIKLFLAKKEGKDDLFDQINPSKLNEYFSKLMPQLTAKVFRTFNASSTLDRELNASVPDSKSNHDELYKFYNEANKKVAVLCNHQKAADKDFDVKISKYTKLVEELEEYLKELNTHLDLIKRKKKGLANTDDGDDEEGSKLKKKFPLTVDGTNDAIAKLKVRIEKEKQKLDEKIGLKNFSLGTSKINYNDPRITISWCKRHEFPIEKVFSRELRAKFTWAMAAEPSWRF